MDGTRSSLSNLIPRSLLGLSNFMVLTSSAIIVGIMSWFLHRWPFRNTHMVYQEVIAVLTLFIYLFTTLLPTLKGYRGYGLPLTTALSYLWLTSLIFSSQDYSGGRCAYNSPPLVGHRSDQCVYKHTIQAFTIIGFVSLFLNMIIEAIMWAEARRNAAATHPGNMDKAVPPMNSVPGTSVPANGGQIV